MNLEVLANVRLDELTVVRRHWLFFFNAFAERERTQREGRQNSLHRGPLRCTKKRDSLGVPRDTRSASRNMRKTGTFRLKAHRSVQTRPVSSQSVHHGIFPDVYFYTQSLGRPHEWRPMASRREQVSALFFVAWTQRPLTESFPWATEGPNPLKETLTFKKKNFWQKAPGSLPAGLKVYCETLQVMKISSLWTVKTIKYEVFFSWKCPGLQYLLAPSVLISRYSLSSLLLWWTFIKLLLRGSVAKAVCSVKSCMIIIMQQEQPDDHHETHTTTTRFCSRRLHRKAHNGNFATRHVPSRRRLPDEQHSLQDDCTHWKRQHIGWQTQHRPHIKNIQRKVCRLSDKLSAQEIRQHHRAFKVCTAAEEEWQDLQYQLGDFKESVCILLLVETVQSLHHEESIATADQKHPLKKRSELASTCCHCREFLLLQFCSPATTGDLEPGWHLSTKHTGHHRRSRTQLTS